MLLGFMTTGDDNSPGNYGLLDMIQMLKFIRKYISLFGGDPSHVTLVGHGTGAGAVGLLMLSDLSTFQGQCLILKDFLSRQVQFKSVKQAWFWFSRCERENDYVDNAICSIDFI